MSMIPNGIIIQDISAPTEFMTKVSYLGVNSFFKDPLSDINNDECRKARDAVFHKRLDDGCYQILEFISDREIFLKYVDLCKRYNVGYRVLFIESDYPLEIWEGEKPPCKLIGYEYCEIPFDCQIITDFSWHEPLSPFLNKLNKYGIFDSMDDAIEFKKKYDEEFCKGVIGDGEMDTFIVKVYEVDTDSL